ncbi:hypothetical protein EKH79_10395 [Dyella dinghuensis]|uniref:YfhO family protein n=1 Tax=Dyella dinghuensis TaxID=1920169 RepID=A0A3S0S464_9GAMM|nr:hypothetical protein [Dyella dinghuensis]RUL64430.1 hypothetical protein EKH79_10395 [Dyella dinghuensis]
MSSENIPFRRLFSVLCLIWLLLNMPVLLGLKAMPWDALDEFYPTVYFNVHHLRLGEAPWWNPYIYSGYPQIADPQGMLFSPLLMSWMLLRQDPGTTWFAWGVLLHVLMGGTAILGILRRDGINALGALVGATVFMAGGVAASRMEHTPDLIAYAYAPVVLLALRYFLASPTFLRGIVFGLAAGAMATQLVQISYLVALMIATYAVIGTLRHWRSYTTTDRWRWCAGMTAAIVFALALALPQLVFSWAYMSMSNRAVMALRDTSNASLDWRAFLTLVDPNALHALRGNYNGPASVVEAYLFIGVLPLLLMVGIKDAWRDSRHRRQLLFFAAVLSVAGLYMCGINTPFYPWLYNWLPGVQHFRRPTDAAYLFNFALAVLAGCAAAHINLKSRRHVIVLVAIASCWLALASLHMRDQGFRWQYATVAAAGFGLLALWRLSKPGTPWRSTLWLLALLVVDYRCFNLNGRFNEQHDSVREFAANPAVPFLERALQNDHPVLPARIETLNTSTEWDDQVALHDIPSTQGYSPVRYELYEQWYGARESSNSPRVDTPFNPSPNSVMGRLLDVEYLVIGHRKDQPPISAPTSFERVFAGKDDDIWRNDLALPRLLTPSSVRLLAAGESPDVTEFGDSDFRQVLWLTPRDEEDAREDHTAASTCNSGVEQAIAVKASLTQLTIRTHSASPAWVVVSDLDFPGWEADVDGQALPIHRANGMFRAVCVPGGDHDVHFTFHPFSMVTYAWRHQHA